MIDALLYASTQMTHVVSMLSDSILLILYAIAINTHLRPRQSMSLAQIDAMNGFMICIIARVNGSPTLQSDLILTMDRQAKQRQWQRYQLRVPFTLVSFNFDCWTKCYYQLPKRPIHPYTHAQFFAYLKFSDLCWYWVFGLCLSNYFCFFFMRHTQ